MNVKKAKMGRPRMDATGNRVTLAVRASRQTIVLLKAIAAREGLSHGQVIDKAIWHYA